MDNRPNKIDWYFQIAKDVALRSPCVSRRRFGAILVKDDAIIATGYAGTVRGAINCGVDCTCLKDLYGEEPYKSYEHCCSIHGEMNAIINAARAGISTVGATLYLSEVNDRNDRPCFLCRRFIIQAGIKDVYYYTKVIGKKFTPVGFLSWSNIQLPIHHEMVTPDWVKLENEWIQDQIKNAPEGKKKEFFPSSTTTKSTPSEAGTRLSMM
jgi:dCMP deaminase